jgi:predicted acyltransferase
MASAVSTKPRLTSLDQFRGYTVAGMFVANFLAPYVAIHSVFKHNGTYFSYADSIMPGFMFVVGCSFRLTYLRRCVGLNKVRTALGYVRRSLILVLLALGIYVFIGDVPRWFQFQELPGELTLDRHIDPGSRSFDFLLDQARQSAPGGNDRSLISAASRIGAALEKPAPEDPKKTGERDGDAAALAIAQRAARVALADAAPSVPAAVERARDWKARGWSGRMILRWRILAARLIKTDLWSTLALIGATQLLVLPWIGCRFWVRVVAIVLYSAVHGLLSYWFNWDFVYGLDNNWMSKLWMAGNDRSFDGGLFGPLCWAMAMLAGTLAYDLVAAPGSRGVAARRLVLWGMAFMVLGYAFSCLTRAYDLSGSELEALRVRRLRQDAEKAWLGHVIEWQRAQLSAASRAAAEKLQGAIAVLEDQLQRYPDLRLAESPILPPWERLLNRSPAELLAEPPFVPPPEDDPQADPPPHVEHRLRNYWMMGKQMPSLSFMTFATGFAFAVYGLFVLASDAGGMQLGVFRTLGTNPLAAYFVHGLMGLVMMLLIPSDAALWICLSGFALFFYFTYWMVRWLEKRKIYWRL